MEGTNVIKIENSKATETVSSLKEIELLAEEDVRLNAVLKHMKKRGISDIFREIKEILYVEDDSIMVGAVRALPYIYYNYVVSMDYFKDTLVHFSDLVVKDICGSTKEDLYLAVEMKNSEVEGYSLKEFATIVEPSCKYYTTVNGESDLIMPASITTDSVFKAIKQCLM